MKKYYLKQNVQVEPLINSWYAWIQILPPGPAAMNIIRRHIPTMQSFVENAEIHEIAVNDPKMKGGPFIDLPASRVNEVSDLLVNTIMNTREQNLFAQSVTELDELLKNEGNGYSLEPLYDKIPESLKGLVELYYDRHHRPDFRFYEPLLYNSIFYNEGFQSISISLIENDKDRSFIFSTPRLPCEKTVDLPIAFKDTRLDQLFSMKNEGASLDQIMNLFDLNSKDSDLFKSFFTEEQPDEYEKYEGENLRIRYFGHACLLIESKDVSVLIDPVLSYSYETAVSRYTYADLPDTIDYVLITHSHHDHILIETMLQIRHKVKNIVVGSNVPGQIQDPSLKLLLRNLGFKNIIELAELEVLESKGVKITGVPFIGEHHDLMVHSKMCYHIELNNRSVLSLADSCNISPLLYERIQKIVGNIDVLFLGMECDGAPASWVYGPLYSNKQEKEKDNSRRGRGCNSTEGMGLVHLFNPSEVYVYAMGAEPWIAYILDVHYTLQSNPIIESNKLIEQCKIEGRYAERIFAEREIVINNQVKLG
ncbi:MBL fold metallo-hydrolase [Flavobacterium sp.]|uniref:MBL fold metallo-hydrolase n=1 Tax=Flavobacterium sp. TaxID=239 RepID=UPI003D102B8E